MKLLGFLKYQRSLAPLNPRRPKVAAARAAGTLQGRHLRAFLFGQVFESEMRGSEDGRDLNSQGAMVEGFSLPTC